MPYIFIYVLIPYILYAYSARSHKTNLLFVYLLLVSIFRFDNVSDYSNYIEMFQNISKGFIPERISVEIGYIYLNKIFSFWDYGYIFVIAISSLAAYYTIYLYFKKYNVIAFAMLLFLAYGSYMSVDNIIRQNIAFAIINLIFYRYLYKGKPLWHIIPAGIVAASFHISALIVTPLFMILPLLRRKILPFSAVFIITIIVYALMSIGVFSEIISKYINTILPSLGVIGDRFMSYSDKEYMEVGFSITRSFKVIISTLPVLLINKVDDKNLKMFINITWIVNIIVLVITGGIGSIVMRILRYLFIFEYISIAYFALYYKSKLSNVYSSNRVLQRMLIIPLFILSFTGAASYFGYNNKYTTIFGNRCKNFLVYERSDMGFLTTSDERLKGRSTYYSIKP